jgi:hypothetical protein
MATDNRILIKSKSTAAGAPATSDLKVGELAVNTYKGVLYMGSSIDSSAGAGDGAAHVSTVGMPISTSDSLGTSDISLSTTGAIKSYVDGQVAAGDTTLANTKIWIGDSNGDKAEFALSGDVTMTAGGDVSLVVGAITSQTELDAAPAASDEFLLNDGGAFKRISIENLAASSEFASGVPTTITVADESSDSECFPLFTTAATGDLAPKSGTNLTFASNTGILTASGFAGPLTGNVTGNASGTAATVTTAAQTAITSLGTLTALDVDLINLNASTLTIKDTTDNADLMTLATTTHGATTLTTVDSDLDDDSALAHFEIAAEGDIILDASGQIKLEPFAGNNVLIDGTVAIDAGVITGATSITSTAFAGALTGNVTGNASGSALTVTQAAQTAITSVGTLTALAVDTVSIDANAITSTSDSLFAITAKAGQSLGLESMRIDAGAVTGLTSVTSTAFVGGLTGNVTGNCSGTAATVTTAAQTAITSLGTLTALTVDDVAINGKVITMTGDTSDTTVITAGSAGTLSIVTTDAAGADADIQITADGTFAVTSTGINISAAGLIEDATIKGGTFT